MGNRASVNGQRGDQSPPSPQVNSPRPPSGTQSPPTGGLEAQGSVSYYTMIKNSYQQLVNAIIRPPRCQYSVEQLGPTHFAFCGKYFQRTDFQLRNPRGLTLECSLWEPLREDRPSERLPCVIYMHGNSSARLEALSSISAVLAIGATMLAFDFAGSGLSEGEYVSLGAYEKDDLQTVIEYLRNAGHTSSISVWGRSMGAATCLLHAERDPSIASMVLDSAFADLIELAEDMVEKGRQQGLFAPSFVIKLALRWVRSSVQKLAHFDIKTISPIAHVDRCFIPALFICAEGDQFILNKHSRALHDHYAGDKQMVVVEGDHNSPRPRYLFETISVFLQSTLQIPYEWRLPEGELFIRRLPWTYRDRERSGDRGGDRDRDRDREHRQREKEAALHLVVGDDEDADTALAIYLSLQQQEHVSSLPHPPPPLSTSLSIDRDRERILSYQASMESIPDPNMSYMTADDFLALTESEKRRETERERELLREELQRQRQSSNHRETTIVHTTQTEIETENQMTREVESSVLSFLSLGRERQTAPRPPGTERDGEERRGKK